MTEWQPIETAPLNGEGYLLTDRDGDVRIGFRREPVSPDDEWYSDDGDIIWEPYAWAPLPQPAKRQVLK